MIKSELRSLITNIVPKEDAFHPRVIDAAIEKVIGEILMELFIADPLALQRFTTKFGYTTPIAVNFNNVTNLYYSNIPCMITPIPDKASGIRRISTMRQGNMPFFPMDRRELDLMYNSNYAEIVNNRVGYVVDQTIIEYYNMSATIALAGVRLDALQVFSAYADTDTVLVPEIKDNQGATFTDRVLKVLQTVQPFNQIDDNATVQAKTK